MSLPNTPPAKTPSKDGSETSAGRKTSALKPPEQTPNCPRCDSPNTKFCYYNNYSLTQPRHFCKTCRRYWTHGGALRNVPIGGGCRKKKPRSNSSSKDTSLNATGGLSLFTGLSPPAMDFQLGGLNHFPSPSINPPGFMNLDSLRFNFPMIKQDLQLHGGLSSFQEIGNANNLASSIESLSSINQDLHWRLQQQRLAALLGTRDGGGGGDGGGDIEQQSQIVIESHAQKLQPIFFQNLETPKPSQTSMETEWFIDGSFESVDVDRAAKIGPTDGNTTGNYESGNISNWNNGIQVWNQFNQYSVLP
ncbi:hypothetical protein L1987_43439 [Smallanthus sonchifolius]|uniref:Uncharacterized protein n=1 Tax=Smallanthus sonchifolius TaxID=185202 RepID=A0ACB9GMB3_9ASTR|nr:hypothetical protein L1987_43439 [Smallanthus sonchifolius]